MRGSQIFLSFCLVVLVIDFEKKYVPGALLGVVGGSGVLKGSKDPVVTSNVVLSVVGRRGRVVLEGLFFLAKGN